MLTPGKERVLENSDEVGVMDLLFHVLGLRPKYGQGEMALYHHNLNHLRGLCYFRKQRVHYKM